MIAELAAHVAALEAERLRPVPSRAEAARIRVRMDRAAACPPISPEQQARHRAELLADLRKTA